MKKRAGPEVEQPLTASVARLIARVDNRCARISMLKVAANLDVDEDRLVAALRDFDDADAMAGKVCTVTQPRESSRTRSHQLGAADLPCD